MRLSLRLSLRWALCALIGSASISASPARLTAQDTLQQPSATIDFSIPESDDGLPGEGPIRRYDWFRNLWKQRRSQWGSQVQQDQNAVVFLGDSITQGWGDDFKGRFSDLKKANRGISGDTTRGMLIRLDEDVLSLNPKGVVMLMGTNDLEEGATPATIASNVKLILDALHDHDPEMPIIVCQVFPSSETKKRSAANIKELNKLVAGIVKGNGQVTLLDTWTLFANAEGDAKPEEFPDLLHPNDAGYAKWVGALNPIFATLGWTETADDSFTVEPGFTTLFNGSDLNGWCYRPMPADMLRARESIYKRTPGEPAWPLVTEQIKMEGPQSMDGRYRAMHGRLVVTTPPEGRCIQILSTNDSFPGDFTLRLEFRATPNADSGIFIRDRQLQCRDFPLAGPYKTLKAYREGDWNTIEIVVRNNVARCTCNGEVLEEAFEIPADGPIGFEGDRGQIEYRRIRIRRD